MLEFIAPVEIPPQEADAVLDGAMLAEPLVELREVAHEGGVAYGTAEAGTLQVDEHDAVITGGGGMDEDICGVHIQVLEPGLVGVGDEFGEGIGQLGNVMATPARVIVGVDQVPVGVEGVGGFEGFGDEQRPLVATVLNIRCTGDRTDGGDTHTQGV